MLRVCQCAVQGVVCLATVERLTRVHAAPLCRSWVEVWMDLRSIQEHGLTQVGYTVP